jgi:hypothetical protein
VDGHRINAGNVPLTGTDDPGFKRVLVLQDGTFEFDFVPEGRYVISIDDAKDTKERIVQTQGSSDLCGRHTSKIWFGPVAVILQTTDIKDLVLAVPASKGN